MGVLIFVFPTICEDLVQRITQEHDGGNHGMVDVLSTAVRILQKKIKRFGALFGKPTKRVFTLTSYYVS